MALDMDEEVNSTPMDPGVYDKPKDDQPVTITVVADNNEQRPPPRDATINIDLREGS